MPQLFVWLCNEYNGLSNEEYVAIKTTLHNMDHRKYICEECLSKFDRRNDGEDLLEKHRRLEGCYGINRPVVYRFDDIQYRTCPGNVTDFGAIFLIELYREYQKGVMPYEGSYVDQPAKVIQAFNVIDNYNSNKLKEDKQKAELKNGNHGRCNNKSQRRL